MKVISLKYDFCIKEIMENEIVRKHFIGDVLGIPLVDIKSVRMMNPFLWKRYKKQKQGILDIQLELNDDTKINIEIQLKQMLNWKKRTVFYLAKMLTADLRRGEDYEKAKKCVAISILDYNIDERKAYHNVYTLRDQYGNEYTDVIELHTIELKKRPSKEQPSPLDEWHSLFNAETEEDLDMIRSETKNLGIIEAIKELKDISITDRIRLEREYRLKAKRDRKAEDDFVFEQGRIAEREAGMKSLINSMHSINATNEQIINALMTEYKLSHEEALERLNF
ncbi:MAG: Rpn family recombination-promoting nuclease/putative transposase [Lachnospiraceae bacterium]|nr:Rpn family recombination-promoting nuclease/putative transposase [Lachnospiraceae bacterium]